MPCYYPLSAWRSIKRNESGKRSLVFSQKDGYYDTNLKIGCGQCRGCRRDKARQWAVRCVHEASLHKENCFITLTFNDKYLDPKGSLRKRDFQLFMKRLRKMYGSGIRYFHCGEYGDRYHRPHHHACLFGFDFPDKIPWKFEKGIILYRSPSLESLWSCPISGDSFGYSSVGSVTYESAAYVAGYCLKKITGDKAPDHYQGRLPEYATMSRGSKKIGTKGIGSAWFKKYGSDILRHGAVVMPGGHKQKVPKYYDRSFELTNPEEYAKIRYERARQSREQKFSHELSQERLHVKQVVEDARYALKKKSLDL